MKKEKKYNLLIILVFCLLSLLPVLWYRSDSVISGGDMGFPLNIEAYLEKGLYAWDDAINAGRDKIVGVSRAPEFFLFKFISILGLSANQVQIIYFSLIIVSLLLSFYFFAKQLVCEENETFNVLTPFLGAIFYTFNLFLITRWEGFDRPIFYVCIGVPLMLGLIIKNGKEEKLKNYLFLGLSSVVLSYAVVNPPSFLTGVFAILLYYFFIFAESLLKRDFNNVKKHFSIAVKSLIVVSFFNLYWLFPSLNISGLKSLYEDLSPIDWLGSISQQTSFLNVIRLMGAWNWYESSGGIPDAPYAQIYFHNHLFIILTYLAPIFVFWGAILSLIKKKFRILVFILIIGIILSMGEHEPFGKIYRYFYDHFIIFGIFRSPWFKFSFLTILAYSFFYGFFAVLIINFVKKFFPKLFSALAIIFFLSFPIILSLPLLKASFFENRRIKAPKYIYDSLNFIDQNLINGQRLYFYTYGQNDNYTWGYQSPAPILFFLSNQSLFGPWVNNFPNDLSSSLLKPVDNYLLSETYQKISNNLSYLGIKYLILRKDILSVDEKQVDYIKNKLEQEVKIKYVKSFSEWDFFENKHLFSLFTFREKIINLADEDEFLEIIGTEDTSDLYCIECGNSQNSIKRYRLRPGDFITNENGIGVFNFEIDKEAEYKFSVKKTENSFGFPEIYLDGDKLELKEADQGFFISEKFVSSGKHNISLKLAPSSQINLIKNGGFSEKLSQWDFFEEGTYFDLPIKSSLEIFGTERVKLQAINKSVVMSQLVFDLKKGNLYRLRFNLKSLGKLPLQIGISKQQKEANEFIVNPKENSFFSKKETTREIIFISPAEKIFINFYSNVNSKIPNIQVISDVSLTEAGLIKFIDIIPQIGKGYQNIEYSKVNPTKYLVNLSTETDGWLNFNVTCNNGWEAKENGKKLKHLCTNGFANGFYLPRPGRHEIEIFYYPEKIFKICLVISIGSILILSLASMVKKNFSNSKVKSNND